MRVWVLTCVGAAASAAAQFRCAQGSIPNSNRTAAAPCQGFEGDECAFACDPGFLAVGRHVCQSYTANAQQVINQSFFGGRCQQLCGNSSAEWTCGAGDVPIRANTSSGCLQTTCQPLNGALITLALGGYNIWQLGRNNRTGTYIDHVDPRLPHEQQDFSYASWDATGLGMVSECVAAALDFISVETAQQRVLLSLQAAMGKVPAFKSARHTGGGWLPTFFNSNTGSNTGRTAHLDTGRLPKRKGAAVSQFSTDSTALHTAGALFAKTFFERTAPTSPLTAQISELAQSAFDAVKWEYPFCSNSGVNGSMSASGDCIPWLFEDPTSCSLCMLPGPDGFYYFNEMHWYTWLAHHKGCGSGGGACANPAVGRMWEAWQGRRLHPNFWYGGHNVLTDFPSFLTQLPFYLVHAFNSDPTYVSLMREQWLAEWAYFNSSAYYAGDDGRYGLGAGPTSPWCAGTGYLADRITNASDAQACRTYSAYAVVGYLPVQPTTILEHVLALLAAGEAVVPVQGGGIALWRKSLLQRDPLLVCPWGTCGITTVDFAAEFFGISTIWLGAEFFSSNTDHWPAAAPEGRAE